MKKDKYITEDQLVSSIKKRLKESNYMYSNMERAELVQDVMDRVLEYGEDYIKALNALNSAFNPSKHKKIQSGTGELPKGVKVKSTYRP
jgi:hypothetical protein